MNKLLTLTLALGLQGLLKAGEADDPFAPFIPKNVPVDPFAPAAPAPADPFAPLIPKTPVDPFAPPTDKAPADPFAPAMPKVPADPFASAADKPPADPFAPAMEKAPADPFAAGKAPADPFATAQPASPSEPALDALKQSIQGYLWTWKGAGADTMVIFQPDGTLLTREKKKSRWEAVDASKVRVTHPDQTSVQLIFNETFTAYSQQGGTARIAGLRGNPLPSAAKSIAVPDQGQEAGKLVVNADEMALPAAWMPHNIHSRKVQLQALGMYSEKVLDRSGGTPDTIWGPVTWLLPLSKAVEMLPRGSYKLRSDRADRLSWPIGISIHFYHSPRSRGIPDDGGIFDEIHFITDAAERVISVQLSNKQGNSPWDGGPDGVMNPYYNFLYDRANARGGRPVEYQVRSAGSGVSCVKIRCGAEVNHWYLTAPLAEKFLEISRRINHP